MGHQVSEKGVNGEEFPELTEDQLYDLPDLFVGIEGHLSRGTSYVAGGDIEAEFAPASLVDLALVHALLDDVQLRLAHRAFEAQQHTVIEVRRIANAIRVGDESAKEGADLQELMPVLRRAGQPGDLHAEDHPHMVEAHLRDQTLESGPVLPLGGGVSQIIVDDQNTLLGPAQVPGAVDQSVLQPGGLLVAKNLLGGGLPDVDHRQALKVDGGYLLRARVGLKEVLIRDHDSSPPCAAASCRVPRSGVPAGR